MVQEIIKFVGMESSWNMVVFCPAFLNKKESHAVLIGDGVVLLSYIAGRASDAAS